jgi:hypothetical protein
MTGLYNLFQNISRLITTKLKSDTKLKDTLLGKPEDYNMTSDSKYLDIGSGFGKPVFHAAFQVGCESKGIEVVPARAEFCMDFFYEFISDKNFFEEIEKKLSTKIESKSDDEDTVFINDSNPPSKLFSISPNLHINKHLCPANNKFKIYHDENCTSFNYCDLLFTNNINWNNLNPTNYLTQGLSNKLYSKNQNKFSNTKIFPEIKINKELTFDDLFISYVKNLEKINKSILIEDNTPIYDTDNFFNSYIPVLQFGKFFILEELTIQIEAIDDHLYSNLVNTLLDCVYTENIDREIFINLNFNNHEKLRKIFDIVEKIDNYKILEFINFVVTIFKSKNSYLDFSFIHKIQSEDISAKSNCENLNSKPKNLDFYEQLKEELKTREKLIKDQLDDDSNPTPEDEIRTLKEVLVDLKFCPMDENNWATKVVFEASDATVPKFYSTGDSFKQNGSPDKHYTHIYSYNKLMSKECRSKIAKILNKTNYKVLAWYSNPKQTKKAGLKDFTFLCKFPMQSTSTEKFHVYVYIKSK